MYEITFTSGFRDSVRKTLPSQGVIKRIQQDLNKLRQDPFQRIPNAKRLKWDKGRRFRLRFGDFRLVYRIDKQLDRIVLAAFGPRRDVYRKNFDTHEIADPGLSNLLGGKHPTQPAAAITFDDAGADEDFEPVTEPHRLEDQRGKTAELEEVLTWISQDELWLLEVPHEHWQTILAARDAEALPESIPWKYRYRVESYITSPESTQIGKIYSLGEEGIDSIIERPLHEFLVALDPQQHRVIESGLNNGPYLVRGGPGTGKSLIGLHAVAAFVKYRRGEYPLLPGEESARYGAITYTNTLSSFNEALLKHLRRNNDQNVNIECTTLDKIVYRLAKEWLHRKLNRGPEIAAGLEARDWMEKYVCPYVAPESQQLIDRLGLDYVMEEIEQVIHDNDLLKRDEYLAIQRHGRRVPLQKSERNAIWDMALFYHEQRKDYPMDTWSVMRKCALRQLEADSSFPRYNALFVDEVQDLPLTARRIILHLVQNPKNLLLTEDTAQSIYIQPPSWRQVSHETDFRGRRSFRLEQNYRTTQQIHDAIAPLRLGGEGDRADSNRPHFSGPRPLWLKGNKNEHAALVEDVIRSMRKTHRLGNMAVVVRTNKHTRFYESALKSKGIDAEIVNRERPIDLEGNAVHVITAYSAKGLEFPVVIVPEVSDSNYPGPGSEDTSDEARQEREEGAARLLYVALSRACRSLVMISDADEPSGHEAGLDPGCWEHEI